MSTSLIASAVLLSGIGIPSQQTGQFETLLTDHLRRQQVKHKLPGLWVCVMRGKDTVANIALGYSDVENDTPASVSDRVMIGSITKPMTGHLAGSLVDAGKISWSSTVSQWLPHLERRFSGHPGLGATLEQLLCHRGGFPREDNLDASKYAKDPSGHRQLQIDRLFMAANPVAPGSAYVYTHGLNLAVSMMEQATDKKYAELMEAYVFRKLGMTSAGFGPTAPSPTTYYLEPGDAVVIGDGHLAKAWSQDPGGSIQCTVEDVARFGALYSSGGVSSTTLRKMLSSPYTPGPTSASLWWEGSWPGWYMHSGNTGRGECAWFAFNAQTNISVAVYYNINRRDGSLRISELEMDLAKSIASGRFGQF